MRLILTCKEGATYVSVKVRSVFISILKRHPSNKTYFLPHFVFVATNFWQYQKYEISMCSRTFVKPDLRSKFCLLFPDRYVFAWQLAIFYCQANFYNCQAKCYNCQAKYYNCQAKCYNRQAKNYNCQANFYNILVK